ncbi:MAG: polysaccharide deacetylase family protein [Nibricoccus sp.]
MPTSLPATSHSAARSPVAFRRPLSFRLWLLSVPLAKIGGIALFFSGHRALGTGIFFSPSLWLLWQFVIPTSHGFGPAIRRFRTKQREVWLTIDDGPDPATTPRVLELLDQHQARATFFVIGEKAARYPELIREIVHRGHALGNHTHTHPHGSYWSALPARTGQEIDTCATAIRNAGEPTPRWFRPPVGLKSLALHQELARRDLELVVWSARGYDTQVRDPDQAVRRIRRSLTAGVIILAHESGPPGSHRVEVIARLLTHLTQDGYRCVIPTSEQLIRD